MSVNVRVYEHNIYTNVMCETALLFDVALYLKG
jgi:hypothetical protein